MSGHISNTTQSATSPCAQSLEGRVEKILWRDTEDDGPLVLKLTDRQCVKVESGSGAIAEGDLLRFLGSYTEHPKYGRQFAAATWGPPTVGDRRGTIKYLADLCDGIGQAKAKLLVDAYGVHAVAVLRDQPARVAYDKLLTATTAHAASAVLHQHRETERVTIDLHGLLAGRGFGGRAIRAAILAWGAAAADIVRTNPWRLLLEDIPGSGWKRVDTLYRDLGGDQAALKRQAMAGWYALREAATGSTWHPQGLWTRGVYQQVEQGTAREDDALRLAVRGRLVEQSPAEIEAGWLADPRQASNERAVAYYLARLMRAGPAAWPALTTPEVSEHQADAVNGAATGRVMLLTGTPGTGKTFAAAALLRLVARSQGVKSIAVAAPTGKAAVRITEALARNGVVIKASTIHSLLQIRKAGHDGGGWTFEHCDSNPLPFQWVAIDEVSMLDTDLAHSLFAAIRPGAHVLLIGDPYQLPPVGHGAPLRDLLSSQVPNANLTEIKRNSGLITTGCQLVKDGRVPEFADRLDVDAGKNLRLLHCPGEADQLQAVRSVLEALRGKPGLDVVWDTVVLTPCNDKGRVSRKPLNLYLQQLLNPPLPTDQRAGQDVWRLRDKVICLKNGWHLRQEFDAGRDICRCSSWHAAGDGSSESDYAYVANGELGAVVAVDGVKPDCILRYDAPRRFISVKAPKPVKHDDGSESAREEGFALGYAITGHKSQGSEWPYVIVMLDPAGDRVASREWIYTAISRASRACLLVGTEDTLRRQLRRAELPGRKTLLVELIKKEMADPGRG
jgi:exodeoxyribonuclease V alpha subunit